MDKHCWGGHCQTAGAAWLGWEPCSAAAAGRQGQALAWGWSAALLSSRAAAGLGSKGGCLARAAA